MANEAEALRALRLALKFVDRAAGEGIFFEADGGTAAMDAADVCIAVSEALGIDFAGPEYSALVDGGPLPDLIHRSALAEDTARAAEGWVTVPRKPTPDMLTAGIEGNPTAWTEGTDQGFAQDVANDVYVSMLAAAPALPLTQEAADANR